MKPEDAQQDRQAQRIFGRAVEMTSAEARLAYLEGACDGDERLKARVVTLLAHHVEDDFLQQPAAALGSEATAVMAVVTEKAGDRIGRYKLLEQIGEGGCGVVYVAEQEEPVRRRVALKVIKLGMDTRNVIARFEAERQALALMDHPNIAKVLDAGATETGRPFFVMELVRGIKLTDYCDQHKLPTRDRLDLFIGVCHAIQHAHQKGIIHRDIKPSNILVTLHDGVPVPKVIDFGIAKATSQQRLTDRTVYTAFEQFIGTPAYMSPEQAEMSGLDIDTRSDVYALGVLLYELLTGRTPFDAKTLLASGLNEMRRIIREQEPVRPSTRLHSLTAEELTTTAQHRHAEPPKLIGLLRGDLDWIVMKCLEKDRTRRYETANGLAGDLERHLNLELVTARPPSTAYRVQRFVRRNKLMVVATAAVAVTLLLGVVASTWLALRESAERKRAEGLVLQEKAQRERAEEAQLLAAAKELDARRYAYVSDMNLAFQRLRENRLRGVRGLLQRHIPSPGVEDLRNWEWGYLWHESESDELWGFEAHAAAVTCVAISPDGKLLASGSTDQTVKVWDLETRIELATLHHEGEVTDLVFSPDHEYLVSADWREPAAIVYYWTVGTWQKARSFTHEGFVTKLTLSHDARFLAFGDSNGKTFLRDGQDSNQSVTLAEAKTLGQAPVFAGAVPIMTALDTSGVGVWNLALNEKLGLIPISLFERESLEYWRFGIPLAISADASALVIGGWSPEARMLSQPDDRIPLTNLTGRTVCLSFSPDGSKLAAADDNRTISVWNRKDWTLWATLKGLDSPATDLAFCPDGRLLVSSSSDRSIRAWSMTRQPESRRFLGFPFSEISSLSISRGEAFAFVSDDNQIAILVGIPNRKTTIQKLPDTRRGLVEVSPDGTLLCFSNAVGKHALWEARTMEQLSPIEGDATFSYWQNGFSPDGTLLLGLDRTARCRVVWGVSDGKAIWRRRYNDYEAGGPLQWWGSDSRTLIMPGTNASTLCLWDVKSDAGGQTLSHPDDVLSAVMSRDGRLIATLDVQGAVTIWARDGLNWNRRHTSQAWGPPELHNWAVFPFDFTPDGQRLAVANSDGVLRVCDTLSGQEVGSPPLGFPAVGCRFSKDGRWLLVGVPGASTCLEAARFEEIDR